jgi:type I restriction enzyme S subunit
VKLEKLGQYVKIRTGKLDANASSPNGEYPFFTCSVNPLRISSYSYDCECILVAGNGDLNVKYYEGKFDAYQRTYIIESLNKEVLNVRYLYYFMEKYVERLRQMSIGGVIKYIKLNYLTDAQIPLPPLPEQKRIAEVLAKADALRGKRRLTLQKLDTLLQSVFLEMFGDPVKNPKGWEVGNIESIVSERSDVRCGPFGTQLKVDELVEDGIPVFGIENVHNNKFVNRVKKFVTEQKAKQLSAFSIKPKDVLVTRMGTIGRACVVPEHVLDGVISYHLFRVRPNPLKCLPEFLSSTICRSGTFQIQLKMFSHGAIMDGLSTANLKNVKFLVPPLELQKKYVDFVKRTEAVILKFEKSKENIENLFQSLQQRAFKGELFSDEFSPVEQQEENVWQRTSLF